MWGVEIDQERVWLGKSESDDSWYFSSQSTTKIMAERNTRHQITNKSNVSHDV